MSTSGPAAAVAKVPVGALAGTFVGFTAWSVVVVVGCLLHDDRAALVEVGVPAVLVSIALWLLMVGVWLGMVRAHGAAAPPTRRALLGCVLLVGGILTWIVERIVLPGLRGHAAVAADFDQLGAATAVPDAVLWACLAAGAALLVAPLRQLWRGPSA